MPLRKIINDPVYGFISIDDPLVMEIISHPYYQRLRRIKQMALAHYVYPGAVHTRLHHSLGAYHLMCEALIELKRKNVEITKEEETGAKLAILLHDIGHGPFSHALESVLVKDLHHEEISLLLMKDLNEQFNGKLQTAVEIFTGSYHKKFLHQLVSGQLDVDRMDYLSRDSFFTGVSEGVIGYDRIIKMLTVHNGELMVEEKAIYSIEKFLVARRLMYWQVYLHKTVLSAEMMLVKILERASELALKGESDIKTEGPLTGFLTGTFIPDSKEGLALFTDLDDNDIMFAIKKWSKSRDKVLSYLCDSLLNRKLFKTILQAQPIDDKELILKKQNACTALNVDMEESKYLAFTGEAVNSLYNPYDERINILFKDGSVKNISMVDNALIQQNLSRPVKKFYICHIA